MVVIARDEDEPYVAGDEGIRQPARRTGPRDWRRGSQDRSRFSASLPTPRRCSQPRRRRYSRSHIACPRVACGSARRLRRRGAWPAWRAALRLPPFTPRLEPALCSKGEVTKTLSVLRASPTTAKAKAKFILATNGADFEAED